MIRNNEFTKIEFSLKDVEFYKQVRREEAVSDPKSDAADKKMPEAIKDRLAKPTRTKRN